MRSKDRKLPRVSAKRFGHRSHVHSGQMIRKLDKGEFFTEIVKKEREKYQK